MEKREKLALLIAKGIAWLLNPFAYILGYIISELNYSYNGGKLINKIKNESTKII